MANNRVFCAKHPDKPRFSTVFSTGVEILGNKPKPPLRPSAHAPKLLIWESATVVQRHAARCPSVDTNNKAVSAVFLALHPGQPRVSTVFSTGAEILRNKPKPPVRASSDAPKLLIWESATVAHRHAVRCPAVDTKNKPRPPPFR